MSSPQIVWLRRDLRLSDQPAFCAAAAAGPVVSVFVLDDKRAGNRQLGGASRWWLHGSLEALARELSRHHSRLILRRGDVVEELRGVAHEIGASSVHALRHYEPWWRTAEEELSGAVDLCLHDGNYLLPPGSVTTGSGGPYKIYTPFAKAAMRSLPQRDPLEVPRLTVPEKWPASDRLENWDLLPAGPDWAVGLRSEWRCGEGAARDQLDDFLDRAGDYDRDRNMPSIEGSSRLSPHLHWGEISPTAVWHAVQAHGGVGADSFRGELLWRDYAQNVIFQFSHYGEASYRDEFTAFPWRDPETDQVAAQELEAWKQGCTGYPIVDAGMRQLWSTGWMHNRVRMIAASFLIKHLLIDWRHGEKWFWDTLVDADYANNGVNWQWAAGSGVDANLFTRIMAPLSQSEKFAAAGYIRRWVPELADLPEDQTHDPDGLFRPADYPGKIIGHKSARERALAVYREMKR